VESVELATTRTSEDEEEGGTRNITSPAGYAASAATLGSLGGYKNFAGPSYPNDANVFGIKVTMWW
jgi:hypothetical protein